MSKLKYLLLFFFTSCSLTFLTKKNIKENQNTDLQIQNGFSAVGEFTYNEQKSPIKGKINLIFDSKNNMWLSVNSLFNLELYRIFLIADTLYLINRIEKNYQKISFQDSTNNINKNLLKKIRDYENTEVVYNGNVFYLLFSESSDEKTTNIPKKIVIKKGEEKEFFLEIKLNQIQRTRQKVEINIPDNYEKI